MSVVSAPPPQQARSARFGFARTRERARAASRVASQDRGGRVRSAGEAGFSLVEILVVLILMSLATTAILGLLEQSGRVVKSDLERDASLNEQAGAFARMIDELRQAYAVNCPSGGCTNNATATAIDFDERVTSTGQADKRVAYNCGVSQSGTSWYECVRYETAASDLSDAVPLGASCSSCKSTIVIQRVVNTPVFSNLTTDTSNEGAVRWISGTATIYTPTGGTYTGAASRYSSDAVFSEPFFMSQLAFGQ